MAMTVYNPQKGRLETIDAAITQENTTWFEDCVQDDDIHSITDFENGLLIREHGYSYPLWIYDLSRADIGYDQRKAKEIQGSADRIASSPRNTGLASLVFPGATEEEIPRPGGEDQF